MDTRFSLKRLFVSTALIAVGLAVMVRVVQVAGRFHWVIDIPVCFLAGALLGAGGAVCVFHDCRYPAEKRAVAAG